MLPSHRELPSPRWLRQSVGSWLVACPLAAMAAGVPPPEVNAAYKIMHVFSGTAGEPRYPLSSLILGSDGKLHGTTMPDGNGGTAYRMTPSGQLTVMHEFGLDGGYWASYLIQAQDGDYYGATIYGGPYDSGSVFRMRPHGAAKDIHVFGAPGACSKPGALMQAASGDIYGVTWEGGAHRAGCLYRITRHGKVVVLHEFDPEHGDGSTPYGGLVEAADGTFYGVTSYGGLHGNGTVFRMSATGKYSVVHSFAADRQEGVTPHERPVQGADGQLYGVTESGGAYDHGTVYRLFADGRLEVVHSFAGPPEDGALPFGRLVRGHDDALYGVTYFGGHHDLGAVYRVTTGGQSSLLHSFAAAGKDGNHPQGWLVEVADGEFYGVIFDAQIGSECCGIVYRVRVK